MFFQINLLPPSKRKSIFNIYILYYLQLFLEILLGYTIIISVIFIFSYNFLTNSLKDFEQTTISMDAEYATINKKIIEVNKILKKIDRIQSNNVDWSNYLYQILSTSHDGITISGMDMQKQAKTLIITGRANTRNQLLIFKDTLTNLNFLKNVELPVSALTAKQNIDFTLNADLNLP